ncbi:MAG: tetratricopeptide repeat protein [Nannocystaceae bacterium]
MLRQEGGLIARVATASGNRRRRLSRIGVFLGCAMLAACASGPKRVDAAAEERAGKHYAVALASFHTGMFEDAKLQLNKALRIAPEHADSFYLIGMIRLHAAKTILDSVDDEACLRDEAADRQRIRADRLHREAYDSFSSAADRYVEGAAGRGRAYNSMSVVSLHFRELERATAEAKRALDVEFYGERYSAYTNLGWAYYGAGDLVGALTELRQAMTLNPDYCVGRYRLARTYLEGQRFDEALEEIARVVQDARCPIQDAHRVQGVARLALSQRDEARASFESCMAVSPRSCLALDCQDLL